MGQGFLRQDIENMFAYHPPTSAAQIERYKIIQEKAKELALIILDNTPQCPDQTAAIRYLRQAIMTANEAVALHPTE